MSKTIDEILATLADYMDDVGFDYAEAWELWCDSDVDDYEQGEDDWVTNKIAKKFYDHEQQTLAEQAKRFEKEKKIAVLEGNLSILDSCTDHNVLLITGEENQYVRNLIHARNDIRKQLAKLKEEV